MTIREKRRLVHAFLPAEPPTMTFTSVSTKRLYSEYMPEDTNHASQNNATQQCVTVRSHPPVMSLDPFMLSF